MSRDARDTIRAVVVLFFVAYVAGRCLTGCASPERAAARSAVNVTAEATRVADKVCADIVLERRDRDLGVRCKKAYDFARASLIATAAGIDAWERSQASRASVICDVVRAARGLEQLANEIHNAGGTIPKVVDDALSLAYRLGACPELP